MVRLLPLGTSTFYICGYAEADEGWVMQSMESSQCICFWGLKGSGLGPLRMDKNPTPNPLNPIESESHLSHGFSSLDSLQAEGVRPIAGQACHSKA